MGDNSNNDSLIKNYREECLEIIRGMGKRITMRKGEQMRSPDLFYLIKGLCALCIEGETGRDISIIYFTPGRLLNFLPSIGEFYPRHNFAGIAPVLSSSFFVKAISDAELFRINKDLFLKEYFHSLPLQTLIVQALVENCSDLFTHIFNSVERPAWQRVAKFIYENMPDSAPGKLRRKITYQEIATHLSIHPVTVAKIFKALQCEGIITRKHSETTINDPEGLLRIALGRAQLYYKSQKRADNNCDDSE